MPFVYSTSRAWAGTSYLILSLFLVSFLLLGFANREHLPISQWKKSRRKFEFPDFDNILHSRTLSEKELSFDENDRIILIGDVHGMNTSLHKLLRKLSYDNTKDVLIFTGDVVAKSSHEGSLSTLDFITANYQTTRTRANSKAETQRIFGVRGNHDQLVVQWREWREWFEKLELPHPSAGSPPISLPNPSTHNDNTELDADITAGKHRDVVGVKTGQDFLSLVEAEWALENERKEDEADSDDWVDVMRKKAEDTWREEWWRRIPEPGKGKHKKEWRMFGDHYWLARDMTKEQAKYFREMSLVLHIPQYHFFVVHAGLLPYDPKHSPKSSRQPLARVPKKGHHHHESLLRLSIPSGSEEYKPLDRPHFIDEDIQLVTQGEEGYRAYGRGRLEARSLSVESLALKEDKLRVMQEDAIIHDIPQNQDWWNLVNMRGVTKKGKITRFLDEGTLWAKLWNDQMEQCRGFDSQLHFHSPSSSYSSEDDEDDTSSDVSHPDSFPCMPSTVVYGHIASMGKDLRRWTKGLDSGCLYGGKLTSLVLTTRGEKEVASLLDGDNDEDNRDLKGETLFGDEDAKVDARVVSVKCEAYRSPDDD